MNRNTKIYYQATSIIFLIIAVLHFFRSIYEWEAVIGGVIIPIWVSWLAVLIAGYLALRGFNALKKR